jgi:hypothetical protein
MFLQSGRHAGIGDGFMRSRIAGEDEVAADILDGDDDRPAGKQIVTEIDRPEEQPRRRGSQRLAALRSQSCFSAPSCGAMNSDGSGGTCLWPGATRLAPRKA